MNRAGSGGADLHQSRPIDSLIFIVLMLYEFPKMLLRDAPSSTHIARWA